MRSSKIETLFPWPDPSDPVHLVRRYHAKLLLVVQKKLRYGHRILLICLGLSQ